MASDPDDNPFARNSAWPKMPQAPFRLVATRRTAPPAPEAPPATITPLFVRPIHAEPPARPAVVAVDPPTIPDPPPQEPVELSPLVVAPARAVRAPPRRSPAPAIVATLVAVAGVLGLALLLSRIQQAALETPDTRPAAVSLASPIAADAAPTPVVTLPVAAPPPRPPARTGAAPTPAPQTGLATEAAATAPLIELPPARPEVVSQPEPAYSPPPPADPEAPVVTRSPYS